jgi:hypothetical protein
MLGAWSSKKPSLVARQQELHYNGSNNCADRSDELSDQLTAGAGAGRGAGVTNVAGAAETSGVGRVAPERAAPLLGACEATLNQKQSEQTAMATVPDSDRAR